MDFTPGKPILLLIGVAIVSGVGLALFPAPARPADDLVLWTFADAHRRAYQEQTRRFAQRGGGEVATELISSQGLDNLLLGMFMSESAGSVLPDATEIEIGSIGRYFRPPVDDVGFLPLNDFLQHGGYRCIGGVSDPGQRGWNALLISDPAIYIFSHGRWSATAADRPGWPDWIPGQGDRIIRSPTDPGEEGWHARLEPDARIYHYDGARWVVDPTRARPDAWVDRILPTRLAPWAKQGVIFGLPEDVHPVTITYRADLFAQAGVDLPAAKTWSDFADCCRQFQAYWAHHGFAHRHAVELSHNSSDDLDLMLLQRHLNLIDADDRPQLTNPTLVQTLVFYTQLVAGGQPIGADPAGGAGLWTNDLLAGNICAVLTPDWKAQELRLYCPSLAGRLRMMPLPRFDSADAPTSTWGGTMMAIPRNARRIERAWRLIEFLCLDAAAGAGDAPGDPDSMIVPPLPERWSEPRWRRPDPYFGGQAIGGLYVELAGQIPARTVTPTTTIAEAELAFVLGRASAYVDENGSAGLEPYCTQLLGLAQADLGRRIAQGRFQ